MKTDQKKKDLREAMSSRLSSLPVWLRLMISFLYEYSLTFIGAHIVLLIIVAIIGNLFTTQGLILTLSITAFLLLRVLNKWFEEH